MVAALPFAIPSTSGGADHPVVHWLRVDTPGTAEPAKPAIQMADDVGGEGRSRWVSYGRNLARGKPYTVSVPSKTQWDAGDPDGTKLTDGIAGPPDAGGAAPRFAACWNQGQNPDITVDLGRRDAGRSASRLAPGGRGGMR